MPCIFHRHAYINIIIDATYLPCVFRLHNSKTNMIGRNEIAWTMQRHIYADLEMHAFSHAISINQPFNQSMTWPQHAYFMQCTMLKGHAHTDETVWYTWTCHHVELKSRHINIFSHWFIFLKTGLNTVTSYTEGDLAEPSSSANTHPHIKKWFSKSGDFEYMPFVRLGSPGHSNMCYKLFIWYKVPVMKKYLLIKTIFLLFECETGELWIYYSFTQCIFDEMFYSVVGWWWVRWHSASTVT